MTPRVWPRGLWDTGAAFVWQSWKAAGESRADVVHQFRLRNVDRMRNRAKSETDSEDAAALGRVRYQMGESEGRCSTCCSIRFLDVYSAFIDPELLLKGGKTYLFLRGYQHQPNRTRLQQMQIFCKILGLEG